MDRRPLWLWPNLLSLDAPLVAVAWLWMFAKTWRVVWLPDILPWVVGGVVWCIYVADRLLDQRNGLSEWRRISARHRFHSENRKVLGFLLGLVMTACFVLLFYLPMSLWAHGAFVLVLVVAYFFVALVQENGGVALLKNLLAGLAFAYGTSVGIHFYRPDSNLFWFLISPEVLLFALLCMLNITAIDIWESSRDQESGGRPMDFALTMLLFLLFAGALFMAVKGDDFNKPFFFAVMVAAAALQIINRVGRSWSLDAQRVMADVAMLLPLPLFVFYSPS